MDEVKKIEHGKILNTDTPDNSASNLDSFLKKNKKRLTTTTPFVSLFSFSRKEIKGLLPLIFLRTNI